MKHDDRIFFYKQLKNIGSAENFKYVLSKATGEYFLLAADDDIRSSNFIEKNLDFLEKNKDYLASTSPTKLESKDISDDEMGVSSIDNNTQEDRILEFLKLWHRNGRFSSLMRMSLMDDAYSDLNFFLGADLGVIAKLLCRGKFNKISSGRVVLGKGGVSSDANIFDVYRNNTIDFIFPFWDLSLYLFRITKFSSTSFKIKLLKRMLWFNYSAFKYSFKSNIFNLYKILLIKK